MSALVGCYWTGIVVVLLLLQIASKYGFTIQFVRCLVVSVTSNVHLLTYKLPTTFICSIYEVIVMS